MAIAGVAMVVVAVPRPTVNIRFVTHDHADPTPRTMQAAVDLGAVGVSIVYTWTVDRLR